MKSPSRAAPLTEAPLDPHLGTDTPAPLKASQPRRNVGLRGLFGITVVVVGAASVVVSGTSGARPSPVVLGGNLPVNPGATDLADINAHNSPSLARNPANATNVVAANRIDSPAFSCALHSSFDGGATWRPTAIPLPPAEEPKCYAPDVAFGAGGTLFVSFVTLKGEGNVPNAVWTATSNDGGRTLSTPSPALGPLAFQVRLVADPATRDRLHLTWLQAEATGTLAFPDPGNPIMTARSDDGGATWTTPERVSTPERARVVAPALAVGRPGQLYVSYLDLGDDRLDYEGAHEGQGGEPYDGKWRLVLARSRDNGKTWTETVVDSLVPTERFVVFIPPAPSLAVDPGRDRVHLAFQDGRLGDADVWAWSSSNGGTSFGPAVRVNDTARGDGTSQYMPKLAVAPGGRLDVIYYDRRRDNANVANEASFQSSYDGGKKFTPRVGLSDRPFDSRIGPGSERNLPDLGNRLALLSTDQRALAVWPDTRAGTDASRKQDLVRAVVGIPRPAELAAPLRNMLRYGGGLLAVAGLALLVSIPLGRRSRKPNIQA